MVKDIFSKAIRSKNDIFYAALLPIIFLAVLILTAFLKPIVYEEACYPLIYLLLFSWCRNMIHIQLCFVTKQRFDPFNLGTLSFVIPSLLFLFTNIDPTTFYLYATLLSGIIFLEFVTSVLRQGSKIL